MSKSGENKKKKTLILLLLFFLLTIGVSLSIGINIGGDNNSNGGVNLEIDKNAQVVPPTTNKVSSSSGVAIPGWSKIIMPANTKTIAVDFFNPEVNKDLYYLTFELRLLDSSEKGYETLYASDLVSPGLHIQEITLSRELEVGEYDGIIHVQPYRMDVNKTATNMADLKTKIIVK